MDLRTTQVDMVKRICKTSVTPELDMQVLLARRMGKTRSWIVAHPEAQLPGEVVKILEEDILRLEKGEPLPYVLGEWEFYGSTFTVTRDVLIPRPETELLVDVSLGWLKEHPGRRYVLDVGTGSGCIAISLALQVPDLRVTATDLSPLALAVALGNAEKLHVAGRISFQHSDLVPGSGVNRFDLITANLPYIPTATLDTLPVAIIEPTLALDGGMDGLQVIGRLLAFAPVILLPGGLLLFEIEADQGVRAKAMAQDIFPSAAVEIRRDLADRDRLLSIQTW